MEQQVVLTLTAEERIAAVAHLRHAARDYGLAASAAELRDSMQTSRAYREWQLEAEELADRLQDAPRADRAHCQRCDDGRADR